MSTNLKFRRQSGPIYTLDILSNDGWSNLKNFFRIPDELESAVDLTCLQARRDGW